MKKYELHKIEENEYLGTFATKAEAAEFMSDYIEEKNEDVDSDDEEYFTPFDFTLDEVEVSEPNEAITDFESARKRLGGKPNLDFTVSKKLVSKNAVRLDDVTLLVQSLNPTHVKSLIALNKLFTIAEAWNKEDGFVPDYDDENQYKYYPWFVYKKEAAGFVFAYTYYAATHTYANIGSRLCFKTANRAHQFGEQFIDLYNEVFLLK